jgi:hypothetical protein
VFTEPRIWLAAVAIIALNVPFGWWRAAQRKFSRTWFIAVHAPVPLAIGMRWAAGIPFRVVLLPVFVAAFFGGQWLGARLRRRHLLPEDGGT